MRRLGWDQAAIASAASAFCVLAFILAPVDGSWPMRRDIVSFVWVTSRWTVTRQGLDNGLLFSSTTLKRIRQAQGVISEGFLVNTLGGGVDEDPASAGRSRENYQRYWRSQVT